MKKINLLSLGLVAFALTALTACSSDDFNDDNNKGNVATQTVDLSITGTLSPQSVDPTSRVAFDQGEGNALKARFEEGDYIRIWFRGNKTVADKDGNPTTADDTHNVDLHITSISDDGRTAKFEAAGIQIPENFQSIHAILAEKDMAVNMASNSLVDDLSSQDGTLEDALRHSLFQANKTIKANDPDIVYTEKNGNAKGQVSIKGLKFANSTAILKYTFTVNADEGVVIDKTTPFVMSSEAGENTTAYYSKVGISWGQPSTSSTRGDLTVRPAEVSKDGNTYTVTAYQAVWPSVDKDGNYTDVKSLYYKVTANELSYDGGVEFKKDIEPGKVYSVPVSMEYTNTNVTHWYNDEAHEVSILPAGREAIEKSDWIDYSNGKITIAPNTTGSPRQGTLVLSKDGGSTSDIYNISQLEAKDFKGKTYEFLSRYLSRNSRFPGESSTSKYGGFTETSDCKTTVTIGEPRKAETLDDWRSSSSTVKVTNNVGIRGLFLNTVLDGSIDIDYENCTARLGLFMDTRDDEGTGQRYTYEETLKKYNPETKKYDGEDSVVTRTKYVFYTAELGAAANTWITFHSKGKKTRYRVWNAYTWEDASSARYNYGSFNRYFYYLPTRPGYAQNARNWNAENNVVQDMRVRHSSQDYIWIWFTLDADLSAFVYQWSDPNYVQQVPFLETDPTYTWNKLLGISVGFWDTSGIADLGNYTNNLNVVAGTDALIYQFDPSSKVAGSRAKNGYTEIRMVNAPAASGKGITAGGYKKK